MSMMKKARIATEPVLTSKKDYSTPNLIEYGKVEEITKGGASGPPEAGSHKNVMG